MEQSRREFAKKTAIVTAGVAVAAGTSVLAATGESSVQDDTNNGVVKGSSRKKEILYRKSAAWEEYYKNAK
ncbi:Tat pathway signal protein [Arcobacter sp. YIC-464]|uniref:Tat pathway signal protein n=1 Tax=Arcobacter sp. YIC-464 TaxID=3376631 RepID=UPI003C1FD48A